MINPFKETNWQPGITERRQFGRSLVLGFPIVALVLLGIGWLFKGQWNANLTLALWLGGIGTGAGVIFYLLPQIAQPFYVVWYGLACCVGIIISNLLLAAFFYLAVTPFGLVRRLFNHSFRKHFERTTPTYWKEAGPSPEASRYFRQF